jgi:hypothetical protein
MVDTMTSVRDLVVYPDIWFINRKLSYKPVHFVTAKTPLKKESAVWVIHTLHGRFTFEGTNEFNEDFEEIVYPSFEDPKEAVLYELKWS